MILPRMHDIYKHRIMDRVQTQFDMFNVLITYHQFEMIQISRTTSNKSSHFKQVQCMYHMINLKWFKQVEPLWTSVKTILNVCKCFQQDESSYMNEFSNGRLQILTSSFETDWGHSLSFESNTHVSELIWIVFHFKTLYMN